MELYTLTRGFFPKEFISEFTSLIWTERYSSAGDMQLVVDPIPSTVAVLAPGTLLGLRGVKEIMMVENQSIENGLLTVTGSSLVKFLNQREAWFPNPDYDGTDTSVNLSADYKATETIGQFLADVVNRTVINPVAFTSYWAPINLDGANDKIPGLALGRIDPNGGAELFSFPLGPIYDGLVQLASDQAEGFKLYLESAQYSTGTYVLRFATYRGKNRTRDQIGTSNLMVRFAPQLDSLSGVKEINSYSEFKNTVYVFYKNQVSVHYIPTLPSTPLGFDRRAIMVDAPDIFLNPGDIPAFRAQVARDALASHLYIQAVDGQVSSKNDYVFERDYYLGDIVELEGFSGRISKARVTEYIRSQDQFGEQEYPTLSVIDPLGTYYGIPDTENTDYTPDWVGEDPNWTDDWTTPDVSVPPDITVNPLDPRLTRVPPLDNPLDPYDFNPDPIPDFGAFDDGSGLGGGDDGGGGGGPGTDVGLTPLGSMKVANWLYGGIDNTDTGYYVHKGKAYVVGTASADGYTYFGSTLLLTNIPAELRPSSPVSSRVLIDHTSSTYEFSYDSGLHIGPWLDVTVNPDGTVALDGGNPFTMVGVDSDSMSLTLILSSISWDTTFVSSDTYASTGSLTDYIATSARLLAETGNTVPADAWANVDGHYAAHEGRLHLDGHVKVASVWGNTYDPLLGIPVVHQPKQAAGSSGWCEVPQKDGYRFMIYPPDSRSHHALLQNGGAQNPQAAGNNGCGYNKPYFYQRYGNGYIARGSSPALSFAPGVSDAGLSFVGCSGHPVGSLPASANWRGNAYTADVSIKLTDVYPLARAFGFPVDVAGDITGPTQFCFVMAIASGMAAYYKVVFTYDEPFNVMSIRVILVGSGNAEQWQVGSHDFTPHPDPDGTVHISFTLQISSNPSDVGFTGTPLSGNYWAIDSYASGSDYVGSVPELVTVSGGKGDMGFHIPAGSSAKVVSAGIGGIGSFPRFVPDDTIDFTGCGWPLT